MAELTAYSHETTGAGVARGRLQCKVGDGCSRKYREGWRSAALILAILVLRLTTVNHDVLVSYLFRRNFSFEKMKFYFIATRR